MVIKKFLRSKSMCRIFKKTSKISIKRLAKKINCLNRNKKEIKIFKNLLKNGGWKLQSKDSNFDKE